MKKVIITIIAVLIAEAIAVVVLIYSGTYNISTYNHDTGVINRALDVGMTRSVKQHARNIAAPSLAAPDLAQKGFGDYNDMCVECHGAPGVPSGELGKGLWPDAPNLARTVPEWTPAELFWITKYGIKFSAMPAWGPTHSDEEIWAMVAFLEKLPHLSPEEYKAMAAKAGPEEHHHQ